MAQLDVPAPPAPAGFQGIWKKFSKGISSLQYEILSRVVYGRLKTAAYFG